MRLSLHLVVRNQVFIRLRERWLNKAVVCVNNTRNGVLISLKTWLMIVCLLLAVVLPHESALASKQTSTNSVILTIEKKVKARFASAPVLVKIAKCESGFRQYSGNRPLRNPSSSATGVMQIMYSVHHKRASRLGHDITTLDGNLAYALYLYKNEGTRPWNASKHCWKRS